MKFLKLATVVLLLLLSSCAKPQEQLEYADEVAIKVIDRTYADFAEEVYYIYTLEYYDVENPDVEDRPYYYFRIFYQTTNGLDNELLKVNVVAYWDGKNLEVFNTKWVRGEEMETIYENYKELIDTRNPVKYTRSDIEQLMTYVKD